MIKLPDNKTIIVIILLAVLLGTPFFGKEIYWNTEKTKSDSIKYFQISDYFKGENPEFFEQSEDNIFHTRLLLPILAYPLTLIVSNNTSYAIINLLFVILTAILVHIITKSIFKDNKSAKISSILFVSSLPIIAYGTRPLTDTISYFFFALVCLFAIEMDINNTKQNIYLLIITTLALLHKETTFFVYITFYLVILINKKVKFFDKIKQWIKFTAILLVSTIPSIIWQSISKASWLKERGGYFIFTKGIILTPFILLITRPILTFHVALVPFIYGLKKINREQIKKFAIILVPSFVLFLAGWLFASPPFSPRIVFFLFLIILPIAAKGIIIIEKKHKINSYIIITAYIFISLIGALMFPSMPVATWNQNTTQNLLTIGFESMKYNLGIVK